MRSTLGRSGPLLALVAVLATGVPAAALSPQASLGTPVGSAPAGRISHPTGPTDVVLRMNTSGGLVPLTYARVQAPEFTLYGDGRAVFRGLDDPAGDGFPPFVQATLDEVQLDTLLLEALDPGGLRDARESYEHRQATDMPTTVFTIDADDVDKSVSVYGLGMTPPDGPDAAVYEGFEQLGVKLATFAELADTGAYQDGQPYQATEYRAFLSPAGDPTLEAVPWPWPDLTPGDFQPYADQEDVRIGGLTPEQAGQATTVPSGGVPVLIVEGPDGIAYTLTIRPLLPGEPVDPATPLSSPSPET